MGFNQWALMTITSTGLIFLGACSGGRSSNEAVKEAPSPAASTIVSASKPSDAPGKPQAGGQVVEAGPYHLEFVPEKAEQGTHLDFFLQNGDNHTPITDAKVTAQIQLPDGTQKSLGLKYDPDGKHYTVMLPGSAAGEYKVAILSDVNGEKVNGRFSFKQ